MNQIKAKAVSDGKIVEGYYVYLDKHYIIPEKHEFFEKTSKNPKIDVDRVVGRSRIEIDPNTIEWPHENLARVRHQAVEEYKQAMKRRYGKDASQAVERVFPRGLYTKDNLGGFVGANVMTKQMLKELCEMSAQRAVKGYDHED